MRTPCVAFERCASEIFPPLRLRALSRRGCQPAGADHRRRRRPPRGIATAREWQIVELLGVSTAHSRAPWCSHRAHRLQPRHHRAAQADGSQREGCRGQPTMYAGGPLFDRPCQLRMYAC